MDEKYIALIPQGPGSIVPRQMRDIDDARAHQAQGFDVRIANDDGTTSPLPEADDTAAPAPAKKAAAKKKA